LSFLTLTPYTRVGGTLTKGVLTVGGTYKKDTKITQEIYDKFKDTIITLKVTDAPKVTRNYDKKKIKTYNTANNPSTYILYTSGDAGYTFKVKCLISAKDKLKDNKSVFYYLNTYFTKGIQVSVVMDIEDSVVPNGVYNISEFNEYKPIRKDYYEVEIEFTKFTSYNPKLTNKCTVLQSYLKQCKKPSSKKVYTAKQIKNKKAKASTCIKYVNKMLYKKGFLSKKIYKKYGSYWTKSSRDALKEFQKRWNKQGLSPKINEKGSISKNCWKAIKRYPEVK
jgi:hypothetical protein